MAANLERLKKRIKTLEEWVDENEAIGGPEGTLDTINYLIAGRQTSYLSDIAGFTDIENDQTSGWGTDFTIDYKVNEKTNIYSFFRYWDIDDSDIATGTFANVLIFQAFEPANTTTEIGIGVSYKF